MRGAGGVQAWPSADWLPPGMACRLVDRTLPGGMFYVGTGLRSAAGDAIEPALIDPWLPVDWSSPDWFGEEMGYWPSYSEISPRSRAAYLRWQEGGRRHRDVPIGYVFLFFYGLERRVLVDLQWDEATRLVELPLIRAEVERLLALFGSHSSFYGYATEFRQFLEAIALVGSVASSGPAPVADQTHPSPRLRLGLGEFARAGRPVPAEWALAWVLSHPGYYPSTSAKRCSGEFAALFRLRYEERHLGGFRVQPSGAELTLSYRPASAGFRGSATLVVPGVPDVFDQALPLRRLGSLADECAEDLDAFSRLVGRDPDQRGRLTSAAMLPKELLDLESGQVGEFVEWARSRLGRFAMSAVPAADFMAWLQAERPAKKDVIALAWILGQAGIGLEPDPRFGGPVPKDGSLVLFHVDEDADAAPSHAYQAAMLLLHLGAAVSAADGQVAPEEKQLLIGHLEQALFLTANERSRLRAHLRWLLTTEIKLTGLTRRIAVIDQAQREHLAGFLVEIAAADGRIDPAEVKALRRIAKLLGLPPEAMDESLQAAAAAVAPATEPVIVRPAEPTPGHAIPPPPQGEPAAGRPEGIKLDESVLAARIAEAAEVAALLGSVFGDDEDSTTVEPAPAPLEVKIVAGLDAAHSELLRALSAHPTLARAAWEDLAAAHRVLPDGALDRLNEAAYEVAGEPVIEGEDPLEINHDALGVIL